MYLRKKIHAVSHHPTESEFSPERRQFMLNSMNLGILGVSGILTGYGFYQAQRRPILEKISVSIKNLAQDFNGFRIVQFSDLHISQTIRRPFVESVVTQINQLNPDMIVFTGDLVDGTVQRLREDARPLIDLSAPYGTFFITGNHEYYSGALSWIDEVTRLGMIPLIDEHMVIKKNGKELTIAGVTDYNANNFIPEHVSSAKKALQNAPSNVPTILLAHQPRNIFEAAENGVDLQISGHTHGGQYFPWHFFVTLAQPFIKGLHKYKNSSIYINRGTGYWGPPMRLGIPSEVTEITLTSS